MKEIESDCPGFAKIQQFRNQIAHSTFTEIKEDDDLDDLFLVIDEAVNALFKEGSLRKQRREWKNVLNHIRNDDISLVEPQTKGFQQQLAAVKAKEVNVEGDQFNAQNVIVHNNNNNIFVFGDVAQMGMGAYRKYELWF